MAECSKGNIVVVCIENARRTAGHRVEVPKVLSAVMIERKTIGEGAEQLALSRNRQIVDARYIPSSGRTLIADDYCRPALRAQLRYRLNRLGGRIDAC
jgi:hypothetical protein